MIADIKRNSKFNSMHLMDNNTLIISGEKECIIIKLETEEMDNTIYATVNIEPKIWKRKDIITMKDDESYSIKDGNIIYRIS